MLNAPGARKEPKQSRNHRLEKKLWHDGSRQTPSLGCGACLDRDTCGGLSIGRAFFDCLDNCCRQPESCDAMCRTKPREFAQRIREIGGFNLDNVPRAAQLPKPAVPSVVPLLYHGNGREAPFAPQTVCLPLYRIIARHRGTERYADARAAAEAFRVRPDTPVILTGTDKDAPLERWWSLGLGRLDAIRRLRDLGVALVTTPNFSLFTDCPRWDDMHSIKRIAITHEEFLREGIPAALHLNARTERDWDRWTEYIARRSEVAHVAFEFATGAGWADRIEWHADQLARLAAEVGRPLHLVVRAANGNVLQGLVSAFAHTTVLDTNSFVKAIKRQRAIETDTGRIEWQKSPTPPNAPVDELLAHNWSVVSRSYDPVFGNAPVPQAAE
ncbi:MAG: DUF4417 domain-containing protein [Alphaproteobacteria bacterium]|nr:DUF4417 domain-containing protein [Alphaproteobacteria bacterium]